MSEFKGKKNRSQLMQDVYRVHDKVERGEVMGLSAYTAGLINTVGAMEMENAELRARIADLETRLNRRSNVGGPTGPQYDMDGCEERENW